MTFKIIAAAALGGTAAIALSTAAFAQAAPPAARAPAAAAPAAAAPAITHGTAPANICVFNGPGAVGASTLGKFVDTRIKQIAGVVNAELTTEQTAIQNEAKTLDGSRATLQQDELERRQAALQVRANALQRKAQLRQNEMDATQQKAFGRVETEIQPLVFAAYQQKGCALLLDRAAAPIYNPSMDITPAVVTALNAKITQFTFDRERLDAAVAGATAPAAPR